MKSYIEQYLNLNSKKDVEKKISNVVLELKKNKNLNAYINLIDSFDSYISSDNKKPLYGVPYAVKDNINVFKTITTGGSKFFEHYVSPYNATVIELLNKAGAIPVAKANLDEFGLGGTGTFSAYGHVYNPIDKDYITSGSSSGSAVLVAKKIVPFALGTDTGDSVRKPASYLGIVGYKPTYGLISRFGVFPYAPSLDHVGILSLTVSDCLKVAKVICKHDKKDFTSQIIADNIFSEDKINKNKKFKVIVFDNLLKYMSKKEKDIFDISLEKIKLYCGIKKISFDEKIINIIPSVYRIISYSEAVSCYQNITGIPFGKKLDGKTFDEKIIKTRSQNFGKELERRFIIGAYCNLSENYEDVFLKSKKYRSLVVSYTKKILDKVDFIIMPGSSSISPTIANLNNKIHKDTCVDDYLQIANFGGFPSITIPMGKINKFPIGLNIMGKINSDADLLYFAENIFNILNKGEI